MSFLRRCNADNKPPADSLDLKLGSVCNQENDWPISIAETVKQPITCSKRCMCRPVFVIERQFDHPLHIGPIYETPTNINNIKLGFGLSHNPKTIHGFSRKKEDGGYYIY
ncbi:uncharacterized protein TNIN_308491 [Trichonephila inaurata madagascariensis]|uniref:Uncharacterized protein n=1 Tax=Trichonephila inaurata madagascariensis TaxID=2747483 RepID=A0A8X6M8U3_9ARAC|nr:uncharacterized protein TNIN_308491 [Trichonephila inaurata madagascariensis]